MDDSKAPELTVDREFRDLIRPLLKDEYRHLEAALLADGCREPITVWKGIIVDGHNRYEICRRLGIPFDIRERHFDNREEAIIWICSNRKDTERTVRTQEILRKALMIQIDIQNTLFSAIRYYEIKSTGFFRQLVQFNFQARSGIS